MTLQRIEPKACSEIGRKDSAHGREVAVDVAGVDDEIVEERQRQVHIDALQNLLDKARVRGWRVAQSEAPANQGGALDHFFESSVLKPSLRPPTQVHGRS